MRLTTCRQKAPDATELKRAKDQILNSFIFRFDTPGKVLREKMSYEFYHYPLDFLERYRSEIDKVTPDQVTTVARKYLQKDKLAVLVVGNDTEFDKPLSSLGPVHEGGHRHPTASEGINGADGATRAGSTVAPPLSPWATCVCHPERGA